MFSPNKSGSLNSIIILTLTTLICTFLQEAVSEMNPNTWRMAETEWKDISGSDLCDRCDEVKNIKNKKVKCGAEIQCACGLVSKGDCETQLNLEGYYCKTPNCRGSYLDYCDKVEHRLVCGVVHPDQPNLHQPPQDPYPSDYMLPMVDSDW